MNQLNERINYLNSHTMVCSECFRGSCDHDAEMIEVDKSMEEILQILNDKNYKTLYHCGGHTNTPFIHVYIMFAGFVNFGYNVGLDVGEGWFYNQKKNILEVFLNKKQTLRLNEEQRVKFIESKQNELLNWANSLPPIEIPQIVKVFSDWEEF